ncbi:iron complex transport system substrate-binding protein [Desulfotomaculum arcticum]|uniref:Iron complex transport system substrate-binding protein n=1 Tax=Desulfotruncus arcticus DSM 17038 TaxID=1121424 RepID=A0A1I2P4X0_9FIRM|nr:ABC transporter substrate-binding protein [Desulfotruncus arcticus]SFG10593.1 iron complex transport system substrate-binding protein [Desulfotomaculum arcticum] [Desulfotruncus arcticus DSM 17038]
MKKLFILMVLVSVALLAAGCGQNSTMTEVDAPENAKSGVNQNTMREITDLGGNVVRLPAAAELNRVVVISPPLASIMYSVLKDTSKIIAANPLTFRNANPVIIQEAFPYLKEVDTGFIKEFSTNAETILNLKPDIVFYYGREQKAGLKDLTIPVVDFMDPEDRNPVSMTVKWEELISAIFEIKNEASIQVEWEKAEKRLESSLQQVQGQKLKGLMIFNNVSNKITVSGNGSYGDYWLEMSGLINAADSVSGEKEVVMEQIYQWNPDVIYIFMGAPASDYLRGIPGQNWSLVKAVKEKRVYDMPQGIFSWASPNADSPLTAQWMASKSYPDHISAEKFKDLLADYYQNRYKMTLSDDLVNSILEPHQTGKP